MVLLITVTSHQQQQQRQFNLCFFYSQLIVVFRIITAPLSLGLGFV